MFHKFTKDQLLRLKKGGPLEERQSGGWISSWFGGSKKADVAEDGNSDFIATVVAIYYYLL